MSTTHYKTVAFLGASTGVGLSALKHTLAAGHRCIALCRHPSKLTTIFPADKNPNLRVIQGNAHDAAAVSQCLLVAANEEGGESSGGRRRLVDEIVSTIGGKFILSKFTIDDAHVCRKGMATLLDSLAQLRSAGATGSPHIIVCSTTGMSRFGRDIPVAMMPLYHVLLKVPHEDKRAMEDRLVESGEAFTIVRASWVVDGESRWKVRVGVEDPKMGRESQAIGYNISKEDAGRWVAENLVLRIERKFVNKIGMVRY